MIYSAKLFTYAPKGIATVWILQMWTDEPWPWHAAHNYYKAKPTKEKIKEDLHEFCTRIRSGSN